MPAKECCDDQSRGGERAMSEQERRGLVREIVHPGGRGMEGMCESIGSLMKPCALCVRVDEALARLAGERDEFRTKYHDAMEALRKIEALQSPCECWDISRTALAGSPGDDLELGYFDAWKGSD